MITDELGRTLALRDTPQRLISLVPSLTEYLFYLGLGQQVVGVTDYCIAPAEAVAALPKLRGTKNPDRAAILALQPDLVLMNKEENRERDVLALAEAGINVYVTDIATVAGARATLSRLAELLNCRAQAAGLLAEIDAELALAPPPGLRYAAAIWRDPWMFVGGATYADDLLAHCGGINIAHEWEGRYPRAELADIRELQPDLLLLPDEPYRFSAADLPDVAGLAPRAELCDGMALTWYGPRIPQSLHTFRQLLAQR
jgi:ABC-type Fe3+-hydroxamate transport system substrate-binding protein